ncbi:MAG: DNA-directed RNA polymerase subunit K [Euryarchaeota archaeon]|nr:DNA-directed RNA polymerase subunit K [Euryarchaeota archaeon]
MNPTRFERARLLGARALQISLGAPPLVEAASPDPLRIAVIEWERGLIPLTTLRMLHARH